MASSAILACLFGWVLFIASALGADVPPDNMPLGPILAAAIVATGVGRAELKAWARRLATFRTSPRWYALAIVAPVAVITAAVLVNHAFGAPLPTRSQLAGWTDLLGDILAILIFVGKDQARLGVLMTAGYVLAAAAAFLANRAHLGPTTKSAREAS